MIEKLLKHKALTEPLLVSALYALSQASTSDMTFKSMMGSKSLIRNAIKAAEVSALLAVLFCESVWQCLRIFEGSVKVCARFCTSMQAWLLVIVLVSIIGTTGF